ncbi:MAG TPA: HAD-IA family hydrolase [Polyangiaceae bacterium]|nr:HAD-IA family hydrolase [Polyangiaceae bacterium]
MSAPRVICFDIGGVLVRICRSWAEACEKAGVPVHAPEWFAGEAAIAARSVVVRAYENGELSTDAYYEAMLGALGRHYTLEEITKIHDAWLIDEYVGVVELVSELTQLPGVTTACLSNTNERHWNVLAPIGGGARFPSVMKLGQRFASHLLRASKPEPKIFVEFQRQIDAGPSEILFFDDAESNVLAARSQGWRAETIDPLGDTCRQLRAHLRAHGLALPFA